MDYKYNTRQEIDSCSRESLTVVNNMNPLKITQELNNNPIIIAKKLHL